MDEQVTYTEELETIIELIVCILFMSFCIFATSYMVKVISPRTVISYKSDKLVELSSYDVNDPSYLTGYQAYMMAWHMDNISTEPVMWLSTTTTSHNPGTGNDADTDNCVTKNEHVILSSLDMDTGEYRNNFIIWRNKHITGAGLNGNPSVQKMINDAADTTFNLNTGDVRFIWSGTGIASDYRFRLEHTYSNMESASGSGRKDSIWQLTPTHVTP